MTAYGAVISLKNTIDYILHSSHISLVEPSLKIIQLAYNELQPLQETLERLDSTSTSRSRKKVNALDAQIKEKIWEFEDLLESLLTDEILSQFPDQVDGGMKGRVWQFQDLLESLLTDQILFQLPDHRRRRLLRKPKGEAGDRLKSTRQFNKPKIISSQSRSLQEDVLLFSMNLQCLQDDVGSFIHTLKDTKREYIYELDNMAEDDEAISSIIGFGGTNSKMIGLSDRFEDVKSYLKPLFFGKDVYALVGMAGVGKTTVAKELFQDPEILSYYECRAWVTVGRKPQLTQLSQGIIAQLCGDETVGDSLEERLEGKKCFIVLDDVWEQQVLDSLIDSLPDVENGFIKILVTARDGNVLGVHTLGLVVRFLNEEESKELLCEKVFGEESCPPQLEKAATKIANNCEGLPLMILTVADILSKSQNRDPEYWNDVAEGRNSVFTDAYNEITEVLFPSYDYLPQYLKMPFLYMGVFPPDCETPPSKIINMLAAEGWFLHTNTKESFEESVWKCLEELCMDKNLVLFDIKSILWKEVLFSWRKFKTCWLHSSWRHVCRVEARKNKFYHVLTRLVDAEEQGQRCLCLQNNKLFGIKDFCNSVRLNCASSTRSLLFFGPYHQYPTPIDVGFRLIRELDALQLRFYTFPTEILTLVLLKYLALTCNGELPTTISKLFNLRVLIIHVHINIRCCRAPSYAPIQIWDMQELEHIEIWGKSLRAPYHVASLEKLSTLVGVNANSGTILELSRRIPNIRKLAVQIELTPFDNHNGLLSFFGCISTLGSLEILKCSIINPVGKSKYVVPATPSSLMLPRGLKKLHLSGMGFSWAYMDVIGSLPYLQVLKLRSYAFRGSKWEPQRDSFLRLKFLLIEDSDLVYLNLDSTSFRGLTYVILKHCYKLERIHWPFSYWDRKIELMDCNPLALTCAEQLEPIRSSRLDLTASSSFHEKPMTINLRRSYNSNGELVNREELR